MAERKYFGYSRLNARASAATAIAALSLSACSPGESRTFDIAPQTQAADAMPPDNDRVEKPLTDDAENLVDIEPARAEMQVYLESDRRRESLSGLIDRAGAELVERAQNGEVDFDGLYIHTEDRTTLAEGGFQEGWVLVQTMPDANGLQMSTVVYTTTEGFDNSKGALSVAIEQVAEDGASTGRVEIEKPNAFDIASQGSSVAGDEKFVAVSYQDITGENKRISPGFTPGKKTPVPSGVTHITPSDTEGLELLDSMAAGAISGVLDVEPISRTE